MSAHGPPPKTTAERAEITPRPVPGQGTASSRRGVRRRASHGAGHRSTGAGPVAGRFAGSPSRSVSGPTRRVGAGGGGAPVPLDAGSGGPAATGRSSSCFPSFGTVRADRPDAPCTAGW